jgi:hypothetical protein
MGGGIVKSSAKVSRTSGFTLVLLCTATLIELAVVALLALASDDVADASPFGRSGTVVVGVAGGVIAVVGAVVGWRGAVGAVRVVAAALLFVAVGIIAVMVMFFVIAGGVTIGLAVLLAHATFSVAMIGRAVLQSAPVGARS